MKNLHQKVVVITGGSSGFGLSLVKKLLKKGCIVHSLSRSAPPIQDPHLTHHPCDVRSYESIEKATEGIENIDILINNAGIILQGPFIDYQPQQVHDVVETDLLGTIYTTHVLLGKFAKSPGTYIVNISSTSGTIPRALETVYCAAKYGIKGFTDSLKLELVGTGIKVVGFYPGGMKTELYSRAKLSTQTDAYMNPDDVAECLVSILEQPDAISTDTVIINRMK